MPSVRPAMPSVRTASFALDLALVVILFVVLSFAAAYRPSPAPTDHYRPAVVTTQQVGPVTAGHGTH